MRSDNDKRKCPARDEAETSEKPKFGPEQIAQMNQELLDQAITLFLPPNYDKSLLPTKAKMLRQWWEADEKTKMHARFCLPLTMASGLGYYILSPATFTVEWDGEQTHDCVVTISDAASHCVIDTHSAHGSFTVQTKFIARTKRLGDFVYIKGVANQLRQPFTVLEAMIESWWSPSEFGIVCLANKPGKFTIQKGEPIAQMFVMNSDQAGYDLRAVDGRPPLWDEWYERRRPEIYNGRNMDYLRGVLPDQRPVCPHFKSWSDANAPLENETFKDLWNQGEQSELQQDFDGAVRWFCKAMLVTDKGIDDAQLDYVVSVAVRRLQDKQLHAQALRILSAYLKLIEANSDAQPLRVLPVLSGMAYSTRWSGDTKSAMALYERVVESKRLNNFEPLTLAESLLDLGTLYDVMQMYQQAEALLLEARAIYGNNLPANDPKCLYAENVYACLLTHLGRYDEAEVLYQQVIEKRATIFGVDSVELADTYNDLAFHFKLSKDFAKSEKYFRMSLANKVSKLGEADLGVAFAYENLSWMFREKNDLRAARVELEQALAIRQTKCYPHDPLLTGTYLSLADICAGQGDLNKAEELRAIARR
ncbi:MAG TPA: DUF6065 family protein [Drouetiella sp.]